MIVSFLRKFCETSTKIVTKLVILVNTRYFKKYLVFLKRIGIFFKNTRHFHNFCLIFVILSFSNSKTDQKHNNFCKNISVIFEFLRNTTKHGHFWYIPMCGNYCVFIGLSFSQNSHFDSDFNRIFEFVHGTHCLTWLKPICLMGVKSSPIIFFEV